MRSRRSASALVTLPRWWSRTSTWTPRADFDLAAALAALRRGAALQPSRLLFSHYGAVSAVDQTLDRSAEEIQLWVEETRQARQAGLDLDHAVAMVAERTRERYAIFEPGADPELAAKYNRVAGAEPTLPT